MATTRATGRRSKEVDEEFLHQLYRGGELLAAGKVIEAKDHLEKAFKLQPKNEKGQNLLGLTYFKLGLFDRAAEIYEGLVRENPADPTLRVNLGLVYLKTNTLPRAIREFETATDLAPEHKKAQNYLGLALAQTGEYARAREHFLLAGSEAMAEKMSRALAGEKFEKPAARAESTAPASGEEAPPPDEVSASEQVLEAREDEIEAQRPAETADEESAGAEAMAQVASPGDASGEAAVAESMRSSVPDASNSAIGWGGLDSPESSEPSIEMVLPPSDGELPAEPNYDMPWPEGQGAPEDLPQETEELPPSELTAPMFVSPKALGDMLPAKPPAPLTPVAVAGRSAPALADLAPSVQLFSDDAAEPFQVRAESVAINVRGEMLTRLSGLIAQSGKLDLKPEYKRSRGRPSDKPFGEGDERMVRAAGTGTLIVETRKQLFVAVELGDESAYFREDRVFAFEEPVVFDNGRVPSAVPPDLDLVNLRGKGKVLLQLPGALSSLEVRPDRPVTVPMQHMVGWHGDLTPRIVPLTVDDKGRPGRAGVELSGEGFALLAVAVG